MMEKELFIVVWEDQRDSVSRTSCRGETSRRLRVKRQYTIKSWQVLAHVVCVYSCWLHISNDNSPLKEYTTPSYSYINPSHFLLIYIPLQKVRTMTACLCLIVIVPMGITSKSI